MFIQRDIENYFSELISILGYKPTKQGAEARRGRSTSTSSTATTRTWDARAHRAEKKYRARRSSSRGNRCASRPPHADAPSVAAPRSDPCARARVLARMALQVELWPSSYRVTGVWHDYTEALRGRAARDGRAPRRVQTAVGALRLRPQEERPPGVQGTQMSPAPLAFPSPQAHHADKAIRLQFRPGR